LSPSDSWKYLSLLVSPVMELLLGRADWWRDLYPSPPSLPLTPAAAAGEPAPMTLLEALSAVCQADDAEERERIARERAAEAEAAADVEMLLHRRSPSACSHLLALLTSVLAAPPPAIALKWKDVVLKLVREAAWSNEACLRAAAQALLKEWLGALLVIRPAFAPPPRQKRAGETLGGQEVAPSSCWILASQASRRAVHEVVEEVTQEAFEVLRRAPAASHEAPASSSGAKQAAALGLLRAAVRGAAPLLSREAWPAAPGEDNLWAKRTSACLGQGDGGSEWLSFGRPCDERAGRWSQGREHGVECMVRFGAQTLDSKWEDQWAEALVASSPDCITFATSHSNADASRWGQDALRLYSGCGVPLPLGGRWLWLAAAAPAASADDWGRHLVARVAGCLKAVQPGVLDAGALGEWAQLAAELVYQPGLLTDLAAQQARAAALLDALSPTPLPRASCSWVLGPLQALVALARLRSWAYGAYLAPLKARPPASLAPICSSLQALCFHEAARVRQVALALAPLALQLYPHMLPALVDDAAAYVKARPALSRRELGGARDVRAGREGSAEHATVVLDVLGCPHLLVRALGDVSLVVRVWRIVSALSELPEAMSASPDGEIDDYRAAAARVWRCSAALLHPPGVILPPSSSSQAGAGARVPVAQEHAWQVLRPTGGSDVGQVCAGGAESRGDADADACRRLCLSVLCLAGGPTARALRRCLLPPGLLSPVFILKLRGPARARRAWARGGAGGGARRARRHRVGGALRGHEHRRPPRRGRRRAHHRARGLRVA